MNRQEALEQMKLSKKVTHQDFASGEYFEIKNNRIQTEDGYDTCYEFLSRPRLADGWEIYNEK